jgi:hypothetical protein
VDVEEDEKGDEDERAMGLAAHFAEHCDDTGEQGLALLEVFGADRAKAMEDVERGGALEP